MTADLSRIDHVILGINDLQKGIEELERLTGVRAVFGGAHPGRGTQNALISLGEPQYLEILAPNPGDAASAEALKTVEFLGPMTSLTPIGWAAQADGLPTLRDRLLSQGIETGKVRPGARNQPDGSRLAWSTLGFSIPRADPLLPFFIEWEKEGAHPSATSPGGCRLTAFHLESPEPETLRKPLETAGLHLEVRPGEKPRLGFSMACPTGAVDF